uniref:Type VII secretion protein EccE n=1 Tax=Streptomyces sp. NBC_00049 TaxID=2903617 RepID=A0AAU2JWX8_9ACTN
MSAGGRPGGGDLADGVFGGRERWGWEFVVPPGVVAHPDEGNPPVWVEPYFPELAELENRRALRLSGPQNVGVVLAILVCGMLTVGLIATALLVVVFLAVSLGTHPARQHGRARQRAVEERQRLWGAHQQRVAAWQQMLHEDRQAQLRRVAVADTWFPVALTSGPARIDVVGGTGDGWAALLATFGGPVLAGGQALLVVDMTEQAVALELADLAARRGIPVAHVPFPAAALRTDLGAESDPEDLAESVAGALATLRPPGTDTDLHTVDVTLIRTVARRLDAPLTYGRLAAGLAVLLRLYEPEADGSGPLAPHEVALLTEAVDSVGRGERRQNELHYVQEQLASLAETPSGEVRDRPTGQWWQPGRLTVLATDDLGPRRKDLADRILFFRLLHALRTRAFPPGSGTLVVAGADHLGRDALEALARHARTAGVRLVLLLEHLREGALQVAGGSGSATVFMRLGNGEEAKAAAEFIGREHSFTVNQLTRQVGETLTTGRGGSYGEQIGESFTSSTGPGGSNAHGTSLSRSWQESVNSSAATSTTTGETTSRLYEFTVEPTQLQALPVTGLVLVEAAPGGRRVVFGDCNPAISGMPRVSPSPR